MDGHIDHNHIKNFYNQVENVWQNDPWHNYSHLIISQFINKYNSYLSGEVLNAGSAGNDYGIKCEEMWHVDIAENKLHSIKKAICANIESLPFQNSSFDSVLCVGSVINYCDAFTVICEFTRVIRAHGNMIIEFESSNGFEYLHKPCFGQDASIIKTSYIEAIHTQWLYSPRYIFNILKNAGFDIVKMKTFHILNGLAYHFMTDENAVSLAKRTDVIVGKIPIIKRYGNNIILLCKKTTRASLQKKQPPMPILLK